MGIVRLILALSVVAVHSGINFAVGGVFAVQFFYIISGFLISFILTETKSYPSVRDFYISRYMRLYPVYAVVATFTLAGYYLMQPSWFDTFKVIPGSATLLLIVSNAIIFFQDLVMFTGVKDGHTIFVSNFLDSDPPLFVGLLVKQAWSLGLELEFYLLAPFIVKSRTLLFGCFALSLLLHVYNLVDGIGWQDPWSYRFFPSQLWCFLAGAIVHQYYNRASAQSRSVSLAISAIVIAFMIMFPLLQFDNEALKIPILIAFSLSLPYLLAFQNRFPADRYLGDLSYPIYISHMLVLNVCKVFIQKLNLTSKITIFVVELGAVFVTAIALDFLVARPFDKLRHRFRRQKRESATDSLRKGVSLSGPPVPSSNPARWPN